MSHTIMSFRTFSILCIFLALAACDTKQKLSGQYREVTNVDSNQPGTSLNTDFVWDFRSDGTVFRTGKMALSISGVGSSIDTNAHGTYTVSGHTVTANLEDVEKTFTFTIEGDGDLITDQNKRLRKQ